MIPEPQFAFHLSLRVGPGLTVGIAVHVMYRTRRQIAIKESFVATMTVSEAKPEEELKDKEVPPQVEEDDEEEEDPGVAPGAGKFLASTGAALSHCSFCGQTAARRRRKRRSPRRRRQLNLTRRGLVFRNFSRAEYIRSARSASTKTSM